MITRSSFDGARMFAQIAHELAAPTDVRTTTERVVQLARSVVECDSTAIWSLTQADTVKLHGATDPVLAEHFGTMIAEVRQGMAWECLRSHATIRVQDIRTDDRWPRYRNAVLRSAEPFLSAVGYSLGEGDKHLGALILASRQPGFFTDELVEIGAIFAQHAAISLDVATAEEKVRNLQTALTSNRRIGMAIGIVMNESRLQDEQAFQMLRAASQHTHRKLRDVAEEVILTGALPSWPSQDLAISAS
jgi:GAF domain-containing protein